MQATAEAPPILADLDQDGILTLTLNRPDKLNAYTSEMGVELSRQIERANEDDAVKVVIVTATGRAFCAGADMSAGATAFDASASAEEGGVLGRGGAGGGSGGSFAVTIYDSKKPVIAALNGHAVGVGITMVLPMDIRIAVEGAKIGLVFARRGLVPEAGSSWFLPRLVGISQALRWCLSGRMITAEEAHAGGLIDEVVPADQLMTRAREIALEIAENCSSVSVALTRQLLWRMLGADHPRAALEADYPLTRALGAGADVKEGVAAFLEKRSPRFTMRVSQDMPPSYPWWDEETG